MRFVADGYDTAFIRDNLERDRDNFLAHLDEGQKIYRADSSKEPSERTRRLVQRLSPSLKALPYRVSISGHTAASKQAGKPGYGPWELSADRANSTLI